MLNWVGWVEIKVLAWTRSNLMLKKKLSVRDGGLDARTRYWLDGGDHLDSIVVNQQFLEIISLMSPKIWKNSSLEPTLLILLLGR